MTILFRVVAIKRPKCTRNNSFYIQINLNIGLYIYIYDLNWFNYIVRSPTVTTSLKNLIMLYFKQGRYDASAQLVNCADKIKNDPSAITQVIEDVRKIQMNYSISNLPANPARPVNLLNQTQTKSRFGMYEF